VTLTNDAVIRYLLGEMADAERDEFETRLFQDEALFQQVAALDDDLVDAYVAGDLRAKDLERVRRSLLSTPRGQERVEFARALSEYARKSGKSHTLPMRIFGDGRSAFLAAASVVLLIGTSFLLWQLTEVRSRLRTAEAQVVSLSGRAQKLEDIVRGYGAAESVVAYTLPLSVERGGGGADLVIPAAARFVVLVVPLQVTSLPAYTALLLQGGAMETWRGNAARLGKTANVRLPADVLRPGNYLLIVKGSKGEAESETMAEYAFRVLRAPQ